MKRRTTKRVTLFALTVSILLLASCILSGCGLLSCEPYVSDKELAAQRAEQIITAINGRDKEGLKSLFSEQAESDAVEAGTSISNKIDSFFEWFQDEITEWKTDSSGVRESIYYGRVDYKLIMGGYYFFTDEQAYTVSTQDVIIDRENPKNVGLYCLWIIHEEEIGKGLVDGSPGLNYRLHNPADEEETIISE